MSNLIQVSFACVPACKACRETGECPKAFDVPASERVETRLSATGAWFLYGPGGCLPSITLPCGCHGIPWPLWHQMGDDFVTITCDKHGEQKLSKNWRAKTKREGLAYERSREVPSGQLDIPPF